MELLLLFILLLLAALLISFALLFFLTKSKTSSKVQLPPGRTGWPIVGETLEYAKMGKKGTPEKFFFERMSKYSKEVFKTSLIFEKTAVFCGAAGNKFIFSNENKLVAMAWPKNVDKIFSNSVTNTTTAGQSSMKLRGMLLGFLKPDILQKCVEIVDAIAKEHLETKWDFQKEVTALPLVKQFVFAEACKLFFSIDDPNHIHDFIELFEVMVAGIYSLPINLPGTSCNRAIKAVDSIRKKILAIIKQRKNDLMEKKPVSSCDILSYMLTDPDYSVKYPTELEIADHIVAVLIASQDSTTITITFTMKYLAELPHIYDEVLKEQRSIAEEKPPGEPLNWKDLEKMKYTWKVASEVLRLVPPVPGNFREALTDFKYSNFFIPKGWKIFWTPFTTHKNPQYFPEPEKFDPSRYEGTGPMAYSYVPFGGGARICPGKDLARLVILVFIYNLVGKFRWEKLIPDEKTVVLPVPLPAKGLPIHLYPH